MYPAIVVTYAQFQASLEEWLTRRQIYEHTAEILTLYAHGVAVATVGAIVADMISEGR